MATDLYDTLDVKRDASDKDISNAYRRLARRYHPDVAGDDPDAETRFKQINAAHDVLSDPKKRAAYDKWGDRWEQAEQLEELEKQRAFAFGGRPGANARFEFGGFPAGGVGDLGDLGDMLGGIFGRGDSAGAHFTRGHGHAAPPARGRDVEHRVSVSLHEAFAGATRVLQIPKPGNSADAVGMTRLEVKIPPGVDNGSRIKVPAKGAPGLAGAPPGDLILIVSVNDDPHFQRSGDDLRADIDVDLATAALGGEVAVQTISGQVALTIPPGTQSGRVFRLTGQGMPRLRGDGRGDLLAAVRLRMPDTLTDQHKDLFRQLRELDQPSAR